MITIGYSTRKTNPEFQEYLKKSCGHPKVEIIEKVNNGEKNLSQVYNEIIKESKHDIVVLCHDDIYFDTSNWCPKLIKNFEKNPEYSILGMAGTTNMPKSGMWWEDRTKMYGIVNHENDGKKWESRYSDSLQNEIKEVVVVDGVFIAINKNNLKSFFDESVSGFHMYDINFCFKNFISGVKIGVITNIRITHKSIGMTNESWDENRKIFSEKYSEFLPSKILLKQKDKLKVLIGCLFFQNFTGSEMYVYELSKNLVKNNCEVSVVAIESNGPLTKLAQKNGIKVYNLKDCPGYKLGDGQWIVQTPQGPQRSVPNNFYKISEVKFDIIHCQHKPITNTLTMLYPTINKVSTIHSEVIELENPVIHESIKKYIAIRPEIKQHLVENFEIDDKNIDVVYNPIDEGKFKFKNSQTKNYVLFVGTVDYLRKNTIYDLVEYTKSINKELWVVGDNKSDYLSDLLENKNVKYFKSTYDIENFIHNSDETAGILLGRTTIEGWMCGKKGWIYDVDDSGNIKSKTLHDVPTDIEKFYSSNVCKKIKEIYIDVINE
jgi:glycosyltransferase involved in cell wall biosynthesis